MKDNLTKKWIILGIIAGITGDLVYPILLAVPNLPDFLKIVLGGMFGILIGVSGFGIAKFLDLHKKTVSARLGAIFLFTGGAMMNLMIVIQQTLVGYFEKYRSQVSDEVILDILRWTERGTTPIHLGIDISWDFFLYIGTFLFGIAMYYHPKFGKIWGITGMILSLGLLSVNLYAFPFTPQDLGLPYIFGPLSGIWYFAIFIKMIFSFGWVNNQLKAADQ